MPVSRLLPILALFLAACAGDPAPAPPPAVPVESGDVTTRDPGEIIMLDLPHLLSVTAEQPDGELYGIRRDSVLQPWFTLDGAPVNEEAVEAWLTRFTPLEATGRYPDLAAEAITTEPAQRLVFRFDDGSARTLALAPQDDGLAVVSQPNGPVFRLHASVLRELVPEPAALYAGTAP